MTRGRAVGVWVAVLAAAGLVPVAVEGFAGDEPEPEVRSPRVETVALERPMTCPAVLDAVRDRTLAQVTPYGLEQGGWSRARMFAAEDQASAPAGVAERSAATTEYGGDFSGTNLQEAGVDEPDVVKNDRRRAFSLYGRTLRVIRLGDDGAVSAAGSIELDVVEGAELLLIDDDVVVLSPIASGGTRVVVVDVADLMAPRVAHTIDVEGQYLSARRVGDAVRLIVTSGGPDFAFTYPQRDDPISRARALRENWATVQRATLADWLPLVSVDDAAPFLPPCDDVYVPPTVAGAGSTSVITLAPGAGKVLDTTSVLVNASEVYATTERLYVAAPTYDPEANEQSTEIHRFDISDPTRAVYEASGSVAGYLISPPWFAQGPVGQWSLSEHDGDLRVATTRQRGGVVLDDVGGVSRLMPQSAPTMDNVVTVLRRDGSALRPIGSVEGIGKNEQLYAVRFMGDVGYVVTFRKVDPLFVIDLADPRAPRVAGELEMPGYSAYLHPIGEGRLLGVGQRDTNVDGIADGTQVSLFDVSDPAHPKRLASLDVGERGAVSGTESDPRTFTWWPDPARAVLTMANFQDPNGFRGAIAVEPSSDNLREVGRMAGGEDVPTCGPWSIGSRTRVIGDSLVLFSAAGVRTSSLLDLAPRASLVFDPGTAAPTPTDYPCAVRGGPAMMVR
jgi:hypothetical protein